MESYEKPYFQLFCTVCDVIENVELFLGNTALTGTQQQFLRKQVEQLKRAQQITEEMVVACQAKRKKVTRKTQKTA
ncbi:MAG: hypothetical protein U0H73_09925, partial [Ruminococcus sp.]|nr:hypothetical protein [Ruminococcus sp.]